VTVQSEPKHWLHLPRSRSLSPATRAFAGYAAAVLGVGAVTAICAPFHARLSDTTVAFAFLLVVLFVAAFWGKWPAFAAAFLGTVSFNFFFLPPLYELTIADRRNWVALGAFLVTAITAGQLSERARRRAAEAEAERKVARAASAYNRSLIEASLDAMIAIGKAGTILDVNAAAVRLTGRSRAELVGTDFADCFMEPDRARADSRQAFREGSVQNSTLSIRRRDGEAVRVLSNASVFRDDRGEVVGVFVVAREIEPGRAAQSETPPPASVEHAPLAPAPSMGDHPVARTVVAMVVPLATVLLQELLWPVLRPFAWLLFYPAVFVSAVVGGRRGGILATAVSCVLVWWLFLPPEHTLLKSQPAYFLAAGAFVLTSVLVSVAQGRLQRTTRAANDALAEARAGNEKVRQASNEIARLVEQASDAIYVADASGRILDVNGAGCNMVGRSRSELVGAAFGDLLSADDAERLRRANEQLARGGVRIVEMGLRRKDGSWLPVELSSKFLPDGRWQGILRDVTERKRAQADLERSNRAHRALSHCNETLIRATDEAELLARICRIVVDEARYRFCWVGRAEMDAAKSVRPLASAGFEDGYLEKAAMTWADDARGRGPTGTAIREGRPIVAKNIATDARFAPWRALALERGYASSIAIPIRFDATKAAMMIYAAEPDAFSDEEVALLCELAGDLAYGIAALRTRADLGALNVELEARVAKRTGELREAHEREAETAGRIQQMLLLDEPPKDVRGLRVAALTVPSQRVAGDFYGFFWHEDNECLDVIVADVMGKGVPAALLGAATKSYFPEALWHLLAKHPKGALPAPKDVVTLAHTHMARHLLGLESFVTACYARFDAALGALTFVDCGHTGAVHVRPESCTVLHGDNLPLGVREGEMYREHTLQLDVGDAVLFFSDGVTEARSERGEMFGVERLVDCVRRNAGADPDALVAAVRQATTEFTGGRPLADDLTCVVVRRVVREAPVARASTEIRSTLGELRGARAFVESFCARLDPPLDARALDALVLAVNEAASNIVKHAYGGRDDRLVEIAAEAFTDRVIVRLRHLGMPFDPASVPVPPFDASRESGFGMFLMSKSVDDVRYYRDDMDRRCIRLEKRRDAR